MKRTLIVCAAAAVLLLAAAAEEPRTPAELVAQLGSDRLADRDMASASLLALGSKARDAVRLALDSTDPEVRARAKELWKKLRWLVVPGADDDIQKLVAEADTGGIDAAHWRDFVENRGAESILLVAEFRAVAPRKNAAPDNPEIVPGGIPVMGVSVSPPQMNAVYGPGLLAVLDNLPPMDVARFIAGTDAAHGRAGLEALLEEVPPTGVDEKTAVCWMRIEIALWNYGKAFDFGRDFSCLNGSPGVVHLCAMAVDRGGLLDKIHEEAGREITDEADPWWLCARLSFYTGLFAALEKKPLIDPLFDLPKNTSIVKASDSALQRLVETLLDAGLPERAVKALHNVRTPLALYMRSAADLQMQNEPAAGADWGDAMNALDDVDDSKKKEAYYAVGELMRHWHDERVVAVWQKVLSITPADTVYDANACFHIGEFLEEQHQYAQAAEFYEKGVAIASKTSGVMIATDQDGRNAGVGEDPVLEKIRYLKSQAAGQKSIFNDPPPAENK